MTITTTLTDSLPAHWLNRTTTVSGRLLLAGGLAGIYFIVAGPLLWRVFRGRAMLWPALGMCAAAFAVVAWIVGSIVMPSNVHVKHMTVLDHVSGSLEHRVQSWMDLQLPGAGNRLILAPTAVDSNELSHTALMRTWQPASAASITFGDVRRLPSATEDGEFVTAARDATTRLHLQWRGVVNPERWGRLFASSPNAPIGIQDDALHGVLENRLDVPIRDMSIIWIQGPATNVGAGGEWIDPTRAGMPLVRGQWWSPVNGELLPGEHIDLSLIDPSPASDLARTLHERQLAFSTSMGLLMLSDAQARHAMELLSLWSLATPPPWAIPAPPVGIEKPIARRERELMPKWALPKRAFGANLDLGPWLASPAMIVLGWIDSSDLPVPLHINGEVADEQNGLILVRWILPLGNVSDTSDEPT